MKDPVGELQELVSGGLVEDIRQIEETVSLYREIQDFSTPLNDAALGPLFGRFQTIAFRHALMTTIGLFDPPADPYPSHGIPTILNHMRYTADYLKMENREAIISRLIAFGHTENECEGIPEPWINQLVRKEFADRLPQPEQPDSGPLSRALASLLHASGQFITHSEEVQVNREWADRENEIALLLEFARDLAVTLAKGYLNMDYGLGNGDSLFRLDTDRTIMAFRDLLSRAGIQS